MLEWLGLAKAGERFPLDFANRPLDFANRPNDSERLGRVILNPPIILSHQAGSSKAAESNSKLLNDGLE